MKAGSYILVMIWSLLLAQPLYAKFCVRQTEDACKRTELTTASCCQKRCEKPAPVPDENDCDNNGCNPLMSCPSGNFFLHHTAFVPEAPLAIEKQRRNLYNDNRIVKYSSDCWHPPRHG